MPPADGPTDARVFPVPRWMRAAGAVCALALVVNVVRDLFVPESRDVEIWFGLEVRGVPALLTAPIHWAIFALGAWAFSTGRTWIIPWAAAYLFYAAFSHLVWSEASANGRGWMIGVVQAIAISAIGVLLLRARSRALPAPGSAAQV
jgi:hypothetical protein